MSAADGVEVAQRERGLLQAGLSRSISAHLVTALAAVGHGNGIASSLVGAAPAEATEGAAEGGAAGLPAAVAAAAPAGAAAALLLPATDAQVISELNAPVLRRLVALFVAEKLAGMSGGTMTAAAAAAEAASITPADHE
jgi:hypothetical protein